MIKDELLPYTVADTFTLLTQTDNIFYELVIDLVYEIVLYSMQQEHNVTPTTNITIPHISAITTAQTSSTPRKKAGTSRVMAASTSRPIRAQHSLLSISAMT